MTKVELELAIDFANACVRAEYNPTLLVAKVDDEGVVSVLRACDGDNLDYSYPFIVGDVNDLSDDLWDEVVHYLETNDELYGRQEVRFEQEWKDEYEQLPFMNHKFGCEVDVNSLASCKLLDQWLNDNPASDEDVEDWKKWKAEEELMTELRNIAAKEAKGLFTPISERFGGLMKTYGSDYSQWVEARVAELKAERE